MLTTKPEDKLACKIQNEGFEYAILDYGSWLEIKSEEFHKARKAYKEARRAMELALENMGIPYTD